MVNDANHWAFENANEIDAAPDYFGINGSINEGNGGSVACLPNE